MPAEGNVREEERVEVCELPYFETWCGGGPEVLSGQFQPLNSFEL